MTVEKLRKAGFKVFVSHKRIMDNRDESIFPRGGSTIVELITPEGIWSTGEALCSQDDNFNKKLGVQIALGRALKSLERNKIPVNTEPEKIENV